MKKYLLYATAACAALAACTKNEVKPVELDQEITYQTITTKAASAMDEGNHFISYAYFLEKDKKWDTYNDRNGASAYISAADISYDRQTKCWKAASPYYWPKQGSLTFFAWSTNNASPSLTPNKPTCSTAKGIEVSSYDITANKNVDCLVAEVAKDKKANETQHQDGEGNTWAKGVPTVFKHALSKLVFKVVTVKNGEPYDYSDDAVTFTVKSIKLKGVNNNKAYSQDWQSSTTPSKHTWTDPTTPVEIEIPVFTGNKVASDTETELPLGPDDYSIVIPQGTFDPDDVIEIVYDITTKFTGTDVTETVTISDKKLSEVYTTGWAPGNEYTLTIKLGIDEVLWDPTLDGWTVGNIEVTI